MKTIKKILCLALLTMLAACAGTPVKFAPVAPAELDLSKGEQISATASGFQLLNLIPISINDRHQRAYEQLKEIAGDRVPTDIRVTERWVYLVIGNIYYTTMDATAYPRLAAKPTK